VVADLDQGQASSLANSLGDNHMGVALNVANEYSIREAKDLVLKKYETIDVLVNNAAINDMFESPQLKEEQSRFENYPLAMWQQALEVNVTGVFLCSQIIGSVLADKGQGSIINIASTYGITAPDQTLYQDEKGRQTFNKSAAYPTTKGAVISFTRFLAAYWGNKGVRVNSLSPGGVRNGQEDYFISNYSKRTPLGRMADATDYQGAVVFLASDASLYMTGANLVVDGGWTII